MGVKDDDYWMGYALAQARKAWQQDEVPVGAVVIYKDELIGEGFNTPIRSIDPTAHAEIIALRQAAHRLNNYRLTNAILYVTLEPCAMCVAAAVHARIAKIIFGALDEKTGALSSDKSLLLSNRLLRDIDFSGGVRAAESRQLLQQFFKQKRQKRFNSVDAQS